MAESAMFLQEFKEQILLAVNTCYPARVLSFDENNSEAKIQPLFMTKDVNEDPETQDVLEGVPLMFQRYRVNNSTTQTYKPVVQKGDVVMCIVAQRSLDDADTGRPYYAGKARIMNMQDSVIVGVIG